MGGGYPNQSFTGYIPAGSEISGDKQFLQSLVGKEIGIQGRVTLYKGKPEIEVTERSQIIQP
jgi:DNA/RNA endonuclease YhcR with UshA esterase domain